MNRELTPADVAKVEADALILASGGIPQKPVIPGVDQENVLTAWEALLAPERVGKKVLVVGAGAVGAETAGFLADRTREVSLIEMAQEIALDEERTNRKLLLRRLGEKGVKIRVVTQARAIPPEGVEVESNGWREILPADTVVLATGVRPNRENCGLRNSKFQNPQSAIQYRSRIPKRRKRGGIDDQKLRGLSFEWGDLVGGPLRKIDEIVRADHLAFTFDLHDGTPFQDEESLFQVWVGVTIGLTSEFDLSQDDFDSFGR